MQKTKKSIAKRFKVTGNKKVLKRACGQDHFNARSSGKLTRKKRRDRTLSKAFTKTVLAATGQL